MDAGADGGAGSGPRLVVDYAAPSAAIAPYVSDYHLYLIETDCPQGHSDIFYPGAANIQVQLGGAPWSARLGDQEIAAIPRAGIAGPTSKAIYGRAASGHMVGAGITARGWARMFGPTADRYADRIQPLEALLGHDAAVLERRLREGRSLADWARIFDDWFQRRIALRPAEPPEVAEIARILLRPGASNVAEVAEELCIHPRRFERLARGYFGFPPKMLLRRARFMRTLMRLREDGPTRWSDRLDPAYHDHSHFIRDCHDFLSMAPGAFLALDRPMNEQSTGLRAALFGSPVQSLQEG